MATANIVTALVAQILKRYFDAPRPKLYFKDSLDRIHFVVGTDQLTLHSFPSGHTVSAFTTAIVITYLCRNKFWGLPLFLLAGLVGYSRMYLGVHYPSDVLVGAVVGAGSAWLSYKGQQWLMKNKHKKAKR